MTSTRIGRYEIERELGAGAMAVVYKAVDPLIGRVVAIKTIKFDSGFGLEASELRQRLYREAQSAGNLSHPAIVTIYDIGEEGSVAYIAMEFIEGETLQEWMTKNPLPPPEQVVSIIEQVASGLDYAAARGITHRDIKPGNILLTADMRAKIADFGIAKFSTAKFTQTGAIMGTPSYMSPEQAMGKTLDGRSDIFSLGVIFYEMLTGERPFTGSNPTTILYKILHEDPVPPKRLNVTLHPSFDHIVGRMLEKDPDRRYQNCAELIHDLKNYASLQTSSEKEQPAAALPVRGGRRRGVSLLVAALLCALGVAGFYVYQRMRSVPAAVPQIDQTQANPERTSSRTTQSAPPPAPGKMASPEPAKELPAPDKTTLEKKGLPPAGEQGLEKKELPPAGEQGLEKKAPIVPKKAPEPVKPARAEVRLEFAGADYAITVFDGARKLQNLTSVNSSVELAAGTHRFRIVSDEVFLDQQLEAVRLKGDQVYTIPLPGLGSAYIEVPNDAYDGCEIQLNGLSLPSPYPAQVPKLAAGDHKIVFRWSAGRYAGKELSSVFTSEANHHFRIRGEPATDQVTVQQIR